MLRCATTRTYLLRRRREKKKIDVKCIDIAVSMAKFFCKNKFGKKKWIVYRILLKQNIDNIDYKSFKVMLSNTIKNKIFIFEIIINKIFLRFIKIPIIPIRKIVSGIMINVKIFILKIVSICVFVNVIYIEFVLKYLSYFY